MFLFESSKEKAIRQDVEKSMQICISNPKKYNEAKEILAAHLRGSDQKVIEMIVDNIKATIKNQDYQPVRKYQAMLLLKDLMLTHNKALGKYVVKKILKRLTILAQHKSGTKDFQRQQQRARDIFGSVKKDQEQYAIKFFNTLLTALQQWGKNWPKAPDGPYKDFHRQYNDLLMNGVQFPKERPKQLSKSVTGGGRMSRQQSRVPPVEPASPPKPKPKQEKAPAAQPPPQPQRQSRLNQQLRDNLDQFYEKTKQPLNMLSELLPEFTSSELPIISDIVGQVEKTIQAGNQLIISIEGDSNFQNDELKLKKCFDFVTKVQKDLRILSKKPEQLEVFKSKYVKLSNQLLDTLARNRSNSISPIRPEPPIGVSPPLPARRQEPTPEKQVKVQQKPKIKIQNRYASVQGNQVIDNFAKTADFNSNSGQSVHSDRFGSFGGPANTERHRASIPIQAQGGSPQVDQNKKKSNSDRKQSQNKDKNKQIPVIPEERTIEMSKQQMASGKLPIQQKTQQKKVQQKPQLESQMLFKEFEAEKKYSEKGSVRNGQPNFEDNSSFGPHHFEKNQQQQQPQQQEDFFAKIEQLNKEVIQNPRRKKNHPRQDNEDFFKVNIESKIDSSKLSGFQFSQKGMDASKNESKNVQYPPQKQPQTSSKKDVFEDNPFGGETSHNDSKNFGNQSNFLDPYQNKSDFFGKSTVTQKVKTQNNENQFNPRLENPFATGNFGNMVEKNAPSANPFDNQSLKSKKEPNNNSLDNPFGNSFDKSSKGSKAAKNSVHSQNKGNLNNSLQNPFQSKVYNPNDNFFEQKLNNSRNNAENPFETQTQKTNKSKNPFEEVQDFYKPPSNHIIDGLSQRNSFKNIQSEHKNNILGGHLGLSGFPEPIRDSLVFSAKVDKQASQYGLNFSQFQDIGGAQNQQRTSEARNSNPFNVSGKKSQHQFSGFSLSNFPGIGEEQQNHNENQDQHNGSAADFFANFQKQSLHSKKSKEKAVVPQQQQKQSKQKNEFQDFFANHSFSNESKSEKRKSSKNQNANANNFVYERQKTVLSGQQKSFDFGQLEKISGIQSKPKKKNEFDAYTQGGKSDKNTKRQDKQGFVIDNKSQKSLSWGDFSARPDQVFDKKEQKQQKQQKESKEPKEQREQRSERDSNDARQNRLLQVESRINIVEQTDRPKEGESKEPTSRVNKFSNEPSLDLQLEDFAPITKKGIEWNPLSKITKLKESPYTYNVDDKKIQLKRLQLNEKQRQYNEKLQIFKFARHKNDEIRSIFMEKMKKVEEIMHQKTEYEQILKKLKETNGLKQNQIEELHAKIKKTEQIKARLLQKQKQFYELTKNQISAEEKKNPAQRSMANKWQMFNKNLQHNRNSMFSMHSQYSNGY